MRFRTMLALVAAVALVAVGCSDDDGDESSSGGGAGTGTTGEVTEQAACDAFVAVDQAIDINEDVEAGLVALQDLVAGLPPEVAEDVEPLIPLLEEDPAAALESEEAVVAEAAIDPWALENCDGQRIDVVAVDYAYDGMPAELEAGRVIFTFVNESDAEAHEAIVLRVPDGTDESGIDLLDDSLADPISLETTYAALANFELATVMFVEPEGGLTQDVVMVDLEPGNYVVACLFPVDSATNLEPYFTGEEVEAPRHTDEGMIVEFTVV